jgi:hypothetical protein
MPSVSRANGDRIWNAGARWGCFLRLAGRRAGGRFEALLPLLPERPDERDDERRDGEVFVAIGRSV